MMRKPVGWVLLAMVSWVAGVGAAEKKGGPGEAVTVGAIELQGAVQPGATCRALIKFKVAPGYHVQSHQPSDDQFIATDLTIRPAAGITAGKVTYPRGKREKIPGLEQPLSVYDGEFAVVVPLTVGKEAALPATVAGSLRYQACQGAQCFAPRELPVSIVLAPRQ